ncbi:hypothetical protein [Salibacterium aidingense]|uniref:hypothetical protein n=1 Tax=Salibacterium aidingense TaxID=384933 RepID=UPI003BCCEC48
MDAVLSNHLDSKVFELFAVRTNPPAVYETAFRPSSWLTVQGLSAFMNKYGRDIYAPEDDMTATFWANRYSRFFAFIHWALAKGYDIDISLEPMMVYHTKRTDHHEPAFEFECSCWKIEEPLDNYTRQAKLLAFYQDHVVPLFRAVAAYAGIRPRELWGQVYHAVPYFMDLSKVTEDAGMQKRMREDWHYLTTETSPEDFREKKHPLQYKCMAVPNPADDKPMYTKPTCCLAYKASSRYCYRCPRMKAEDRANCYQKYKEEQK